MVYDYYFTLEEKQSYPSHSELIGESNRTMDFAEIFGKIQNER